MEADQAPLAEMKPEDEDGAVHDQVPEADGGTAPVALTEKVPVNEHDPPAPPIPSIVKLPPSPGGFIRPLSAGSYANSDERDCTE